MLKKIFSSWKDDDLLRRVIKNSSFLFGSNTVSAVLIFIQGILAVRLIGVSNWGLIATITTFATNINRLLGFRMSEVVVKRLGQALAAQKQQEAAAVVKTAGMVEIATSIIAFFVLFTLSPWAARTFAKDLQTEPLFIFYGLTLLSNIVYETSSGIIQTNRRFDRLARINLIQSVITSSVISISFILGIKAGPLPISISIRNVLLAYVLGKAYAGTSVAMFALQEVKAMSGKDWWRVPLRILHEKRGMFGFMLNTNLNGTVNLLMRDNIPLYMAALLSTTEVGYLKIAMVLITPIILILDPFIWPTYTEITHSIAERQWDSTLRLLRRISIVAVMIVLGVGGVVALTGWWLIPTLYGADAKPAYFALLILLCGYGIGGILQWHRPLLLALGKPGFPLLVFTCTGIIELGLIFWLVPKYGYLFMAAILSGYFVVAAGIDVWRGLYLIKQKSTAGNPE